MNNTTNNILFVIFDNYKTERLGIQILSAIAREEGFNPSLIILNDHSPAEAIEKAQAAGPRIVAYSAMTFEQFDLQRFNRELKRTRLEFTSIFGGHHYTFNPEEIEKDTAIDIVCRGEGETAWRRFIRAVREGEDWGEIPNLWVRRLNRIVKNPIAPLIENLDLIPFADRELIPLFESGEQIYGKSFGLLFTRGCPHRCAYCFNSTWNRLYGGDRVIRHRGVENVIAELEQLVREHNPDLMYFHDDDFTLLPNETINEFCCYYKLRINKPFYIQARATGITEGLVKKLKEAGLAVVGIGVECGDETVAREVLQRRGVSNRDILRAFGILRKHGIKSFSQNLSALPVPNPLEVDLETIRLNAKARPTWSQCALLVPLPKTPIAEYAAKMGYLKPETLSRPERLPSVFTATSFSYSDPRLTDRVNNLHKFASISIKFPFLLPVVKLLIRLPPNPIFQYICFAWYGYWNTAGLWNTRISFKLLLSGLKEVRKYLSKHSGGGNGTAR